MTVSLDAVLEAITVWARSRPDVEALILVGSQTRQAAHPGSDIDLFLLCEEPSYYRGKDEWLSHFGDILDVIDEQWGVVSTRRVVYQSGWEIEFNLATPAWGALPLDAGTRQVLEDGYRILFDRSGRLARRIEQALTKD